MSDSVKFTIYTKGQKAFTGEFASFDKDPQGRHNLTAYNILQRIKTQEGHVSAGVWVDPMAIWAVAVEPEDAHKIQP